MRVISVLWVLNEIFQKKYPENMKKIVGAVWALPDKARMYLQPDYGNGVFGNVYLSAGQH